MEKFAIGALLGALGGALLVANNYKMQRLVKKGQTEAIEKMAPQDLKKYMMENYETFDPEEFDELGNAYLFKSAILAAKIDMIKIYVEAM